MWKFIESLDFSLFHLIHREMEVTLLDPIFIGLSEFNDSPFFVVFILSIIIFNFYKKGRKIGSQFIIALTLSVGISDFISHTVIKKNIQRPRPRHHDQLDVRLKTREHAGFSFTSNHAANSFAAATTLAFFYRFLSPLFFIIAFLVSYSRVYVGVHFPLDIVMGALLGFSIAFSINKIVLRRAH